MAAPKLTSSQSSYLKRLYLDGGYAPLTNSIFRTAAALHAKGMVVVEILDPTRGRVAITDDGRRVAKAIVDLFASPVGRIDMTAIARCPKERP